MNGFELAREVREARPETKVLYMSGYTDNHMAGGLGAGRRRAVPPEAVHGGRR